MPACLPPDPAQALDLLKRVAHGAKDSRAIDGVAESVKYLQTLGARKPSQAKPSQAKPSQAKPGCASARVFACACVRIRVAPRCARVSVRTHAGMCVHTHAHTYTHTHTHARHGYPDVTTAEMGRRTGSGTGRVGAPVDRV